MTDEGAGERHLFLSAVAAGPRDQRRALAVAAASLGVFALMAPFAQVKLAPVPAFIPAYESALAVNDAVTAVLLYAQFTLMRSRALLLLASGYLFAAVIAVPHALTFPGLVVPEGLLGAGPQTTAWLYMFWHAGFPLAVVGYAWLKDEDIGKAGARRAIAAAVATVAILVIAITALTTTGQALLPPIMQGNAYTDVMIAVVGSVWAVSFLALVLLWLKRPHSVLDVWLMVVMVAWLADVALSAVLNAGRFDLGFYAGRIYGLLAASFVLMVLLIETGALYARLARSFEMERRRRETRLDELQSELIHVARVSELGQRIATMAHEVNQPLTAITNYVRAGEQFIKRGEPQRAQTALQKAAGESLRAAQIIQRLREYVKKHDASRRLEALPPLIEEATALALVGLERLEARLSLRLDPAADAAFVDKVQFQQVLLNLVRNADEAMAGCKRREIFIATAPAADGMVEVSVADTGPGIEAAVRERLFRPFVTTKQGGMGVGLNICRTIVEAHGGRIWVDANEDGGAVFRFTLPASEAVADAAIPPTR